MKTITRIANAYLLLVGLEYIVAGTVLFTPLVFLGAVLGLFGLVAPVSLMMGSLSLGAGNSSELFSFEPNIFFYVLPLLSIAGGIVATVGAVYIFQHKRVGYRIWLFFVALSLVVSMWNIVVIGPNEDFRFISLVWAFSYVIALWLVWKDSYSTVS